MPLAQLRHHPGAAGLAAIAAAATAAWTAARATAVPVTARLVHPTSCRWFSLGLRTVWPHLASGSRVLALLMLRPIYLVNSISCPQPWWRVRLPGL